MISRGIGKSAARSVARPLSQFGSGGGVAPPAYDTDAQAYITAVEAADSQSLETGVKDAINAFVVGCKSDGIWTAIKASCILAGARTLTGALVPLVGTAPTNNNFVSGDYSRTAGLTGDGSTKYLDSNRLSSSDPQDNCHLSIYGTDGISVLGKTLIGANAGYFSIIQVAAIAGTARLSLNSTITANSYTTPAGGFFAGVSRNSSTDVSYRLGETAASYSLASAGQVNHNVFVFARSDIGVPVLHYSDSLAFYSIGESLDLALLDSRVTTLITDIGTALA